ncbi:MAG: hypothetical protein J5947_00325 [Clostridium sp.]|nr:hypothetical protein [Clostridium sp.]
MNGMVLMSPEMVRYMNTMLPGLAAAFVLLRIAKWRIFTKAGFAGWKSVIPFYEGYLTFRIALRGWLYWICLASSAAAFVMAAFPGKKTGLLELMSVVIDFTAVGLRIGVLTFLAEKFGKGAFFMAGIVVFSQFFLTWLAFDRNAVYLGNPAENIPPAGGPELRKEKA